MFVPIFTSFGIENSPQHSALISLLKLYFILFGDPVFQHGASLVNMIALITFDNIILLIHAF